MNEIELKLLITEESIDFIKKWDSFAFLQKQRTIFDQLLL